MLEKPGVFPGTQEAGDEDFHQRVERPQEEWVFTFRAQTEAVSPRKRELRDYAAGTVMYYILAMTVKENVLQEFKSVEDTQELEFWRCSQQEWEPMQQGRFTEMLTGILRQEYVDPLTPSVEVWERSVAMYDEKSEQIIPEAVWTSVLIKGIEDDKIRECITLNALRVAIDPEMVDETVHSTKTSRHWTRTTESVGVPVPTKIGEVQQRSGKGKKGLATAVQEAHGGEAVETPTQPQQQPALAAAVQQQWSLQSLAKESARLANQLQSMADENALLADQARQQRQEAQTLQLSAIIPALWPGADGDSGIIKTNAAIAQDKGFDGWVLYDTGSGVTACGEHDFTDIPLEPAKILPPMEAATGDGVKILGQRTVSFKTSFGDILRITFQVGNLTRSIVSTEAFLEAGCETQLQEQGCKIIMPSGSPVEVVRRHASFWLRLERVCDSQELALSLMVATSRSGAKAVPMDEQEERPRGSPSSVAPAVAPAEDVPLEYEDGREPVRGLPDACD